MFSDINFDGVLSLFIFCIEFILLLNILFFANRNRTNKIAFIMLSCLTAYQFIEFLICNRMIQSPSIAYSAFFIISFLPPLGFLLVTSFNNRFNRMNYLILIPAIAILAYYATRIETFKVAKCTVIYASYNYPLGDLYGLIYYLPILATLIILLQGAKNRSATDIRNLNILLIVGYVIIIIPSVFGFIFYHEYWRIVESVMCKFAFFFAAALSYFTLKNGKLRKEIKTVF